VFNPKAALCKVFIRVAFFNYTLFFLRCFDIIYYQRIERKSRFKKNEVNDEKKNSTSVYNLSSISLRHHSLDVSFSNAKSHRSSRPFRYYFNRYCIYAVDELSEKA
jgi:hypothetical protein